MKKLSLLLSILLFSVSFASLTHASSEDITIGTKTYTQSEAQKQIVEPLLKRIEKQKIAKTKIRLVNLAIRQYTNKQKIAQKQGKTDLANFYGTIITTLKGEVSKIPVISVSTANNTSSQNKLKQNTTTSGSVNNGGSSNNVNNITGSSTLSQEDTQKVVIQRDIISIYNSNGGANQSKSFFIKVITDQFGPNTYAVQYANTLKFNDTVSTSGTTSSSNGNVVNNSQQSGEAGSYNGTSGMTQEQIAHRMIENDILTLYTQGSNGANQSKAGFIAFVTEQYGPNTYAVQYANTFTFNQP